MTIRPLHDRVVVKRIEQSEAVQGGLYIPDSAKEKPQEGEVVAVGKGKRLEDGKVVPLDVQVGDRILGRIRRPSPQELVNVLGLDVERVDEDDRTTLLLHLRAQGYPLIHLNELYHAGNYPAATIPWTRWHTDTFYSRFVKLV